MKSLMVLWKQLSDELGSWCHVSTTLDYNKLQRRVEHEGDQFLMITLPQFGKDFERSLELGAVVPGLFSGFARKGGLPLFLGGFLERVFDRGTGRLLDTPCEDSIFSVRQLTLVFGKMLRPVSNDRVVAALRGYVAVDEEVRQMDKVRCQELDEEFEAMSSLLFADVLSDLDLAVYEGALKPKHGPGSTADRLFGNEKYNQVEWTQRLERHFPFLENVLPSPSYWRELDHVVFLEPDAERAVKVVTVPKTLKTPRIIAIEPTCMQFMQQAISERLVQNLERRVVVNCSRPNIAYGFVGFTSQDPNREMARFGSHNQTLATLDMSEASDRVSNQHVQLLLRRWPHVNGAVQATRSWKADVPGHGVIQLAKYASMGSALCFPVEAMVFTTLVFLGIQKVLSRPLTRRDVESFRGQVRVYGDDIIVPVEYVNSVIQCLEAFGLKVNKDKSFWNGKFRESCGGDYYNGRWVTPVRLRRDIPSSLKQAQEVASIVSFRNQLYFAGLWQTCRWLDEQIERLLGYYPVVAPTAMWVSGEELSTAKSNLLGRVSFLPPKAERMHRSLHSPLVKGWYVTAKIPPNHLEGPGALMKWYLKRGEAPFEDRNHLERAGRPLFVDIKRGWRSPM